MFEYLKRNQLRISITMTLVSFFIILVSQAGQSRMENMFTHLIQTIAYPFQQSSHFAVSNVSDLWGGYIWLINVRDENKQLKKTIGQLKEANARYVETSLAYDRLLASLEFKRTNPDKKIFAEVIAEAEEGYSKILILNKGSRDGIRKNFAVTTPDGIVGKISYVTQLQAGVQLIIDPQTQFPALIQRTRTKVILKGSPEGELILTMVPRRMELQFKDRIVSSGLAGIFPKGLYVGEIEQVVKKEFGLFQSAILKPAVDFSRIEEVFVILESKSNIHSPLFTEETTN